VFGTRPVRARPITTSPIVTVLRSTRPITLERTTLPVLARTTDPRGRAWARVRLPGRVLTAAPPPRTGWIRTTRTRRSSTPWHIVVTRSLRRVTVYRDGRRVRNFPAIVGKPATPTPPGRFFVEENVRLSAAYPGAPFALATSARSSVLQEFEGGPGQIALHGLAGVGGRLGTAVSHGCVRLDRRAITWLAARMTPGVPITIV
jgi:lipoprotein-anchoring transpeptidase ErfK/SrfK